MTYKLFSGKKGYDGRLKKLLKLERKAGSSIISIDEGDTFTLITVENKGGNAHAEIKMPEAVVPVRMDTENGKPGRAEVLPEVQAIPEKRSAEKSKPEKIKTLNMTLTPESFDAVLSGKKRIIRTRHNSRKDQYFKVTAPGFAKIKNDGRLIRCKIDRIEDDPLEIRVHIGKIIETSGCPCKHPPDRLYSWSGKDRQGKFTAVVCCRCGDVLKGNAAHFEK